MPVSRLDGFRAVVSQSRCCSPAEHPAASWERVGGRTQGEEQNNHKIKGTRELTD